MEDYVNKVAAIAKAKYDFTLDIIEAYADTIEQCYNANLSPRRTVEIIAQEIFYLT